MSRELLDILLLVTGIVTSGQLALGVWQMMRARHYRRIRRTEQIRLEIGDARCRLVHVAARGELSPETATFKQLYLVQTSLMRATDEYGALSEAMWAKVLKFEKRGTSSTGSEGTTLLSARMDPIGWRSRQLLEAPCSIVETPPSLSLSRMDAAPPISVSPAPLLDDGGARCAWHPVESIAWRGGV